MLAKRRLPNSTNTGERKPILEEEQIAVRVHVCVLLIDQHIPQHSTMYEVSW